MLFYIVHTTTQQSKVINDNRILGGQKK